MMAGTAFAFMSPCMERFDGTHEQFANTRDDGNKCSFNACKEDKT